MADNNKAVGPLAAGKLVSLIKAETAKKYDKTGGKIEGSAEITGGLKVGGSSEFSSSINAGSEISSDMLLMAPIVALHDPATEESISFGVSGENAAKVTSPVSGGGVQYARIAVGTPTGDNDAATKAYVDGRTHDYYDVTVTSSEGAAQTIDGGIISVLGSADKTVSEIAAAYAAGYIVRCIYNGNIMQLVRAADGSYSFSGVGANYGVARSGNITITIMSTSNGDVTWITSAAGELPIPDSDVSKNGCVLVVGNGQWMYSADKFIPATQTSNGLMSAEDKVKLDGIEDGATMVIVDDTMSCTSTNPVQNKVVKTALDGKAGTAVASASANGLMSKDDKAKLDGVEDGANKTTVDAALDAASENPVQNKVVKAALDGKLSTRGGEISGHLSVGLTVSAEGSVSVGRTSSDTGIHFEKAASDAGRISHGSDPMTGVSPIARLKVADPTDDDDAATKKYVDGRAVRYDAAQGLTSDQKFRACQNIGAVNQKGAWMEGNVMLLPRGADGAFAINITPSEKSNDYTLTLDAGPENVPVRLSGIETPTDADTNAAATVEYVLGKALPAVTAADNGKILKVVNGAWQAVSPD